MLNTAGSKCLEHSGLLSIALTGVEFVCDVAVFGQGDGMCVARVVWFLKAEVEWIATLLPIELEMIF